MVLCSRHRSAKKTFDLVERYQRKQEVLSHTIALYLHAALGNPPLRSALLLACATCTSRELNK
jgi:hypothetical protein